MTIKQAIRGKKVLFAGEQTFRECTILIDQDGVISEIKEYQYVLPEGVELIRDCADNEVLMGGLVDSHVHVNEPGRTEWEGFHSATHAAAAGGVTTIIDMPLNSSPVTTSFDHLQTKIQSMEGKCFVDVGLLGGIVPGNLKEIKRMIVEGGVVGFKSFMVHSGIDDFEAVNQADIQAAMVVMEDLKQQKKDVVMMFHAEIAEPIDKACEGLKDSDPHAYSTFLASRPKESENQAIDLIIELTKVQQVRTHIVHLSSSDAIANLRKAIVEDKLPITAETTFHYLFFESEKIPDGNTLYKCCPPIRESENRDELWKALDEDIVGLVVSDHSPCTINLKLLESGDFMKAWGGISSLQLGLSIVWTECKKRGIPMYRLTEWMSDAPARLVNLNDKKGSIAVGRDADFVVFDPDQSFTVDQSQLYVKNRASPYHSSTLNGVILETILRGQVIYSVKSGHAKQPHGQRVVPTNIHSNPTYPSPYLPPIARLNQMDRDNFFNVVHLLFETAPPLANALYDARPFSSYNDLIDVADTIIQKCSDQDKILIINAHPRIGVNPADIKTQSTLSFREQGCDNEQLNEEVERVYQALQQLNEQYETKNGFKFVVFVAGRPKSEIVKVLEQRLQNNNTMDELKIGLSDMTTIARDRLKKLNL
ncbi:allantoinase [Cavenderia fasciculata]|uniref:allantoinase n=1 Tax=Cavenderia fasciculata TaxID=261658 RepID=F4PQS2_CACFS|nr:allantoinase [Cavenderia fasciculata]EGG22030.1 allantoinase [Cavenderia fasciculata]|eukprot:XP_004359881.1 allantoinase [Cavenderia fasciculata]